MRWRAIDRGVLLETPMEWAFWGDGVCMCERMTTRSHGAYLLNVFGLPFFCVI
jgi:hypothetical protein